jgi:hypothetical protein
MNLAENNVTRKGRCARGVSLSDGVVRDRIGGLPFADKYRGLVVLRSPIVEVRRGCVSTPAEPAPRAGATPRSYPTA